MYVCKHAPVVNNNNNINNNNNNNTNNNNNSNNNDNDDNNANTTTTTTTTNYIPLNMYNGDRSCVSLYCIKHKSLGVPLGFSAVQQRTIQVQPHLSVNKGQKKNYSGNNKSKKAYK